MNKKDIVDSIFFPRKSYIEKDNKDHLVSVEKGVSVGVRFFLKDKSFDNILFFHGNAELSQEYGDIASYYNFHNCNFIVADYRGYGLSSGFPDRDNLLSDSVVIFDYIKKYLDTANFSKKFIVMGRSLGSCSAWEICSKRKDFINGCIIESGFATEDFILDLFDLNSPQINFELSDGFENLKKIQNFDLPLLVIHADEDHIVPIRQANLTIESALSENKKIFVVESANHNNIIHCIREKYFQMIRNFIDSIE